MIKLIDEKDSTSKDIIAKLKGDARLKDFNIDIFNVNQFQIVLDELDACSKCKGLDKCPNTTKGYIHVPVSNGCDYNFPIKPCKRMQKDLDLKKNNNLIKTKYISSGVLEAKLEDFDLNTKSRQKAFEYANKFISNYSKDNFMPGLNIYGGYGSGKTYFLSALANELGKKGLSVLLIYFPDLCREMKQMQFDPNLEILINELKTVDVLMLDDLGGEVLTSFVRDEVLGPVLNYRMSDKKALFISSNLNREQMLEHFYQTKDESYNNIRDEQKGARIARRIGSLTLSIDFQNNIYNG